MKLRLFSALLLAGLLTAAAAFARQPVDELYDKAEYRIAMRDSVKLYTAVYTPKTDAKAPILIFRTPYGCAPYGPGEFPRGFGSGYMRSYIDRGYIVVMQDVRGRFMSEGEFVHVRPAGYGETDETTDSYDTVEWLVKHVPHNNGRVGFAGSSYPGFYAMMGLTEKSGDIMRTVDKLDKIGPDKVRGLLTGELGLTEAAAGDILRFIAITGSNQEVLTALEGYRGRNEVFDAGLTELETVVKYLAAFGVPEENFAVDLTIARGLDYYTGTVYETTLLDHPEIGSVCSGGRYDNLAEYYTDRQLPGVGISIGLTRLFYVLGEQGMLNPQLPTAPADVLILPMTAELTPAIQLSTRLRAAGVRTQLYTEQKKFKAKMNYADKIGVPYVVFLGDDEVSAGVVACKDMVSGEQTTLPFDETLQRLSLIHI